jgi:hypothetical protein
MSNKTFGFLPSDMDRTIFSQRVSKIQALPLMGQFIVLEFEKDFYQTPTSGISFGIALENIINAFEQQFKTSIVVGENSSLAVFLKNYSLGYLSYLSKLFKILSNCSYVPNNYSSTLSFFFDNSFEAFYIKDVAYSTLPKIWNIGTTGLTINPMLLFNCGSNGYSTLTVNEFFNCMRNTINVIKWLESENNELPFIGTVDGVKAASYETILNDQLQRINNLSDIVANVNIKIINEGQAKKDAINALIATKKIEIEGKKKIKREDIAAMNTLANNYDSILASQKTAITQSLGV